MKLRFARFSSKMSMFLTYVLVFIIPLMLIGLVCYVLIDGYSFSKAEEHFAQENEEMAVPLDKQIQVIRNLVVKISGEKWAENLVDAGQTYESIPISMCYDIQDSFSRLLSSGFSQSPFLSDVYICFNQCNLFLMSSTMCRLNYFLDKGFSSQILTSAALSDIIGGTNNRQLVRLGDYSVFLQPMNGYFYIDTIPFITKVNAQASLLASISPADLVKHLKDTTPDSRIGGYIFDQDYRLVAGNNIDNQFLLDFDPKILDLKNTRTSFVDQKGNTVFVSQSAESGWWYFLQVPSAIMRESSNRIGLMMLATLFVAILAGLLLSYNLVQVNYRPINKVIHSVKAMLGQDEIVIKENEYLWLESVLNNIFEQNKTILHERYLEKLIDKMTVFDPKLFDALAALGINLDKRFFRCLGFVTDLEDHMLKEIKEQCARCAIDIYPITADRNQLAILNYAAESEFLTLTQALIQPDVLPAESIVGVSCVYQSIADLPTCYNEVVEILNSMFYDSQKTVITYDEINKFRSLLKYSIDREFSLANSLKTGDYANAVCEFRQLVKKHSGNASTKPYAVRQLIASVILTVSRVINETGLNESIQINTDQIKQFDRLEDAIAYIENLFYDLCSAQVGRKAGLSDVMALAVNEYVQAHFTDDSLSLSVLARRFNLSLASMSKFFKERFENNFHEYVNKMRINRSKDLIQQNPNVNLSDIGRMVGYVDDGTFRRLFKRFVGVTPGTYRNHADSQDGLAE